MHKLYVAGLGRGGKEVIPELFNEKRLPAGLHTCIFHATPFHLQAEMEKKGFLQIINLQEEMEKNNKQGIEIKSGDPPLSLKKICVQTAVHILKILREAGSALLLLPGRPWPGGALLMALEAEAKKSEGEISLEVLPGEENGSAVLDFLKNDLERDFSRGVTVFDAHYLEELNDPPRGELFITHPCSGEILCGVREQLLNIYPPQHPVNVLQFDDRGGLFLLQSTPLEQLGWRGGAFHCWTYLHLPPLFNYSLGEMSAIVRQLRSPEGCPWDRQQDHFSLKSCLLEETHEVLEAINKGVPADLCEELGDVLLQVVFHSVLAAEKEQFSLWQVIDGLARKIRRRHPHVFQDAKASSVAEVRMKWQEIKQQEKGGKKTDRMAIPMELSALMKAQKIQKRAAEVGFDWPKIEGAVEKFYEESRELSAAQKTGDPLQIEEEMGDLLFALVNLARFLGVNAEIALSLAVEKFIRRFRYIEEQVERHGGDFARFTLEELDHWWNEAKKLE